MKFLEILLRKKSICPSCKKELTKKPSRKTKCPFCAQFIFKRTDPETRKEILVTEKETKEIAKKWEEKSIVYRYLNNLEQFGVSKSDFDKTKIILSQRFGKEAPVRDVIWGLFNQVIARTNDIKVMSGIYYEMALFTNEEGRNSSRYLELHHKMILLDYKNSGVGMKIKVLAAPDSCSECKKLSGKVFSIGEALEEMPIPNKKCFYKFEENKKPFCRCTYLPEI